MLNDLMSENQLSIMLIISFIVMLYDALVSQFK